MRRFLFGCVVVPALALAGAPPAFAKGYKCKATAGGARYTLSFRKGRIRAAGLSFSGRVLSDGSIEFSPMGERFVLGGGGVVYGRGGSTTGRHSCDLGRAAGDLE